jgi:uncharacterized membrane protein
MKSKLIWFGIAGLVLISFGSSFYLDARLPGLMVSHWNAQGLADGYSNKTTALFLIPGMMVGMIILLSLVPLIDPLKENIQKFRSTYGLFLLGFTAFMTYLHILTLVWNLGVKMNMTTWMMPGMALLFYASGELIGHARQNYFIGIRTPWTLANPQVWDDTHRIGGIAFKILAGITLLATILGKYAMFVMLVAILAISLSLIGYSYFRFVELSRPKD